jgi:hypothetical protein
MPRPAHHAPEHQALVVNLPGGAANRLLHADRGRFQGAILGLMWLELLSVIPQHHRLPEAWFFSQHHLNYNQLKN